MKGNEAVNRVAKNATKFPKISLNIRPPASDLTRLSKRLIFKNWFLYWKNQKNNNKLLEIKREPLPWPTSHRKNRSEEMKIARLRIGHTRLTPVISFKQPFPP